MLIEQYERGQVVYPVPAAINTFDPQCLSVCTGLGVGEHETGDKLCAFSGLGFQQLLSAVEDADLQVVERSVVGHDFVEFEERVVPAPEQKTRRLIVAVVGRDGRKSLNV